MSLCRRHYRNPRQRHRVKTPLDRVGEVEGSCRIRVEKWSHLMPFDSIPNQWRALLENDFCDMWEERADHLYNGQGDLFPSRENLFRAFGECPLDDLKVVIIGEEPYDNGNADGLAFSVPYGRVIPPTLWIIFSEICHDLCPGVQHTNGNLSRWARQGVLLLNSRITTGKAPGSIRWGDFSRHVVRKISEREVGVVFMLWGKKAISKGNCIMNVQNRHLILKSSHPSSLSAFDTVGTDGQQTYGQRFAGCKHFSRTNTWLMCHRGCVVDWR